MADWEDWEAEAEKPVVLPKKDNKFADEEDEAVPIESKPEITIKSQPQNQDKLAQKEKQAKINKKWDDKDKQFDDILDQKQGPLTAEQRKKAEQLSKEASDKNALELFGGFLGENENPDLKNEQAFVEYAKKIGAILLKEERKKYIQEFMKELLQQLYPKLTSIEYEQVHSKCTTLFNQKQKDEKGTGAKKKPVAKLNASKANAKLMGYDDDEEDEEVGRGIGRFEGDDFM